jgi:23S rRNA (adenine2503-C2)-methyltransferase
VGHNPAHKETEHQQNTYIAHGNHGFWHATPPTKFLKVLIGYNNYHFVTHKAKYLHTISSLALPQPLSRGFTGTLFCVIKTENRINEIRDMRSEIWMKNAELIDLRNLTLPELEALVTSLGEKPYRARQILNWLYQNPVSTFDEMTNLPKTFRTKIESVSSLSTLVTTAVKTARDGTRKFLFTLLDGNTIESVLIPEKKHLTICISTQVGCAMGCTFCLSGKDGLIRNLTAAEMVNQIYVIKNDSIDKDQTINIVFMGMGEPLANFYNTCKALRILTDPLGFNFPPRRITVSTAGLIPQIKKLGQESPVNLAISLNASTDQIRNVLMPINRKYPLDKLIKSASQVTLPSRKLITFEYILIDGVNDSLNDARILASRLRGLHCKVNLIPFNEHEGVSFKRPTTQAVDQFQQYLSSQHLRVLVRYSKGTAIAAACGQLRCGGRTG